MHSMSSIFPILCGIVAFVDSAASTSVEPVKSQATSSISWHPCYPSDNPARLSCGTFEVPMDYDDPAIGRINVTFAKLRATGTSKGNLHFNPGGPGAGSTVDFFKLAAQQEVFSSDITKNYDLIGLDPRGSGRSNNIQCDAKIFNERYDPAPTNLTGYNKLVNYFKRLGDSCVELSGPVIKYVDTVSAVRDFDTLRALLGDDKFHYLGISYGTLIGQQYAELFPERVGRFALDAVIDHTTTPSYQIYAEATAVEGTFNEFLQWCDASPSKCAIAGGKGAAANFDELITKVRKAPIPAPGCNNTYCRSEVNEFDLQTAVQSGLAAKEANVLGAGWQELASSLAESLKDNATGLSPGLAPFIDEYSTYSILAQDWAGPNSGQDYLNLLKVVDVYAPRTRAISSTSLLIYAIRSGWPVPARNPNHAIDHRKVANLPKVLMVNAFYDPLTALAWAANVHGQIPNSHFVMRNGAGHTSIFTKGQTRDAIAAWLVDGTLPADGTVFPS